MRGMEGGRPRDGRGGRPKEGRGGKPGKPDDEEDEGNKEEEGRDVERRLGLELLPLLLPPPPLPLLLLLVPVLPLLLLVVGLSKSRGLLPRPYTFESLS